MNRLPSPRLATAAALALFLPLASRSAEWPQWRGPNRTGVLSDPAHPLSKIPAEPKVLWKIDAGDGQASPVVSQGKLVFLDAQNGQETVHCLDATSGKTLWTVPLAPTVQFQNNYGDGPRCTPLIDGQKVYVQSASGEFRCLALQDGKTLWRTNFEKDYGATFLGNSSKDPEAKETASRRHGNNGSAAIDGDRIFVPVGSPKGATLVCFDKNSCKELWRAGNDNTAYASVMVATLAGTRQAIHFTADALMGVDAGSGQILWRVPLKTGAKRHVCTPVISGDHVVVASTSIGTLNFKISKSGSEWKAEQAWAAPKVQTVIGTPVLAGDFLYTLGAGSRTDLLCLDFKTGNQLWAQPGFGDYASLTVLNDKLLVLNSTGELHVAQLSSEGYQPLVQFQAIGKTWASPAYANGVLFVKDSTQVAALQIAP